jgi:hypothetical protein
MRHQAAVEMTQLPRAAPSILVDDGTMAPKLGRGFVEEGDAALSVRGVDGNRQRLHHVDGLGAGKPDTSMLNGIHRP